MGFDCENTRILYDLCKQKGIKVDMSAGNNGTILNPNWEVRCEAGHYTTYGSASTIADASSVAAGKMLSYFPHKVVAV